MTHRQEAEQELEQGLEQEQAQQPERELDQDLEGCPLWDSSWLRALPGGTSIGARWGISAPKWGHTERHGEWWRSGARILLLSKLAGWTVGGAFRIVKAGQLLLLADLLKRRGCSAWLDRQGSRAQKCGILESDANDFSRWKEIDLFGQDKRGSQVRVKVMYKLLRSKR